MRPPCRDGTQQMTKHGPSIGNYILQSDTHSARPNRYAHEPTPSFHRALPRPLPPSPRRSHACAMELLHCDPPEELSAHLLNELALTRPPAFIYQAQLPPYAPLRRRAEAAAGAVSGAGGAAAALRRAGVMGATGAGGVGGLGVAEDDVEQLVGYGCYAAVAMVDVRALRALRVALGPVLADRHWQVGHWAMGKG